ncbi:ParB/RepB/Spo0J family partition protein [Sedimentitalea todarodis]|uniref:ParB/RepB/Spo0J family partition protein n=1 Tax=Sedimentitalea todarodis TaxID=1631240 RepID=A0ABU3VF00_9RHOB|nr:ParB/RepB/Spo0J family partition protein [Sedimentitalea todarodis]MDU9004755.1 ParB/RepB/Spo0J family partition protein [Sedimentitalea todarodis]
MARSLTSTLDKLAASGKLDSFTAGKRPDAGNVAFIALSSIEADPDQPRRIFDEEKLQSLSESIREQGVLQPITVQPANADGKHLIIMGERRWRAAQLAGLTAIPAMVREVTAELQAIQLTENVQRADLTTMEIAQAVEHMRKDGKKRAEIAGALGWSESAVSRYAGIAKMPDELKALAQANAPILALSDLNSLWKKDEAAARAFVATTSAEDISRTSVAMLRSSLEAVPREMTTGTDARDRPASTPSSLPEPAAENSTEAGNAVPNSPTGAVAILCRHGEDIGRILTDRLARSNKALMVSFANGERVEEIALSDIELLEVVAL